MKKLLQSKLYPGIRIVYYNGVVEEILAITDVHVKYKYVKGMSGDERWCPVEYYYSLSTEDGYIRPNFKRYYEAYKGI